LPQAARLRREASKERLHQPTEPEYRGNRKTASSRHPMFFQIPGNGIQRKYVE